MTPDPLLRFRPEFPGLATCNYLVSHSLGAMPRGAAEAVAAWTEEWTLRGVRAWSEGWWDLPRTVGDHVARIIGAPAGSVAMQPNVTSAVASFLSALEFDAPRDTLVTTTAEFPSVLYLLRGRASAARVHEVPTEHGLSLDETRVVEAIDESTRVVVISHVLFRSGFVVDVPAIVERARDVGAFVLLDAYASVGTVPLDVEALGVDAAVGGCLKWLCGGPGTSFLYVRPELARTLQPKLVGWQAHRDPFAFDAGEHRPRVDAGRFLLGTPAVPALKAAGAGLALVEEAGVENIRAKSLHLTRRLLERADAEGWPVPTPRDDVRRGGTVTVDPPHAFGVYCALLEREIVVDYRPGAGIRIAPHFYNEAGEIDAAADAIADILRSGEWKRHPERVTGQVN